MTKETGGFAFAAHAVCSDGAAFQEGMTLRDWFAGQALQGLMAHFGPADGFIDAGICAYKLAAAMIEARKS